MKAKQSPVPDVANQKNLQAHNVNVLQIENPHQKMEGVQRVNKEEVIKMVEKAKQGGAGDGNFVKLQNYEFKVDVVEDDDAPKKIIKKDNKKDDKKDVKKPAKAASKASESTPAEEEPAEEVVEEPADEEEPPKQIKPQPKWVDAAPPPPRKQEEDQEEEEIDIEDDELLGSDAEVEEAPVIPKDEAVSESKTGSSQKKYRSGMASMMEEMMSASAVEEPQPKKQQQPKDDAYDIKDFEQQQKKYLKTIKQYQIRIKKLNNKLEQVAEPKNLAVIQEEPEIDYQQKFEAQDKEEDIQSNSNNIYQEFYKSAALEEQLKGLVHRDKQEQEQQMKLLQQQQEMMEQMKMEHQREMDRMVQYYQNQLKNMQLKVKRYEGYAAQQVLAPKAKEKLVPEGLSLISSNISNVIQGQELEDFQNDPELAEIDPDQLTIADVSMSMLGKANMKFDQSSIDLDDLNNYGNEEISISDLGQSEVSSVSSGIDSIITQNERKQFESQIKKNYDKLNYQPSRKTPIKNDSSVGNLVSDQELVNSEVSSNIDAYMVCQRCYYEPKRKQHIGRDRFKDIDSDITDLIGDDSELGFDYAKTKENAPQRHRVINTGKQFEVDSDIGDLIDRKEQEELMQEEGFSRIDSQLSISQVLDLNQVVQLVKAAKPKNPKYRDLDSELGSIISENEQQALRGESQFEQVDCSLECSNSDIDSIISENERRWMQEQVMYWKTDSNVVEELDPQRNDDPDSSFYRKLADELERDYRIPKQDKLEIYRRIIAKAKKEYSEQLKSREHTIQYEKKSSMVPKIHSQKSDGSSSIGSLISQREQAVLLNNSRYNSMGSSFGSKSSKKSVKKQSKMPKGCSDMNSSISSMMSRGSQDIYGHDPQYSQMDSKVSMKSSNLSKQSGATSRSKKSVADFLNFKKGIVNDLSRIAKGKEEKTKDLSFKQKYDKFIAIKSREEQLKQIDSSISGLASSIDRDSLYGIDSNVSAMDEF